MKFIQMHDLLRRELNRRIDHGVLSVSLLTRQTRLAQAHISNFLHNRRRLSLNALDRVLTAQRLEAENLLPSSSGWRGKHPLDDNVVYIPIVSHRTAIADPVIYGSAVIGLMPLLTDALAACGDRPHSSRLAWERFVAVRIPAEDSQPMAPLIGPQAMIVLDRHYNSLFPFRGGRASLYAVQHGARLSVRFAEFLAGRVVLRPLNHESPVELLEIDPGKRPQDVVVGRIVLVQNPM